jgi:hypothetical protein
MDEDHDWHVRLPLEPRPLPVANAKLWQGRVTFDSCVISAVRYHRRIAGCFAIAQTESSRELAELLKQLDFLLKSAYVLHNQYIRLSAGASASSDYPLCQHTHFVLDLYTSAFYYIGHRVQVLAVGQQKSTVALPGFSGYLKSTGVSHTRNQVIEHPQAKASVSIGGTALHSLYGPRVRSMRDGKPLDGSGPGWLFRDASALEASLRDVLSRAHRYLDTQSTSGTR